MRISTVVLVLLLAGCGPTVQSMTLSPEQFPARQADHPIPIYRSSVPQCAFEEVGLLIGSPRWRSLDRLAERMRADARRMGGDAIIALSTPQPASGGSVVGVSMQDASPALIVGTVAGDESRQFVATVIRFADPLCSR